MSERKSLDQLIHETVNEVKYSVDVPEMDDIWDNIEKSEKETPKTTRKTERPTLIAACLMVVIILSLTINDIGYSRLVKSIKVFFQRDNGTLQISNEPEQGNDIYSLSEVEEQLQRVKEESSFSIKELGYLPEGYALVNIDTRYTENLLTRIKLIYAYNDDFLTFIQTSIKGDYASGLQVAENGVYTQEVINEVTYNLVQYDHGSVMILWDYKEMQFRLSGPLSMDEMIKIAIEIR